MAIVPEGYRNGHYLPSNNFPKSQDCKISAVFEDKRSGTIYYEYTKNEVQLKNLVNPNPSAYMDAPYWNNNAASSQPRLHAYDYQLYDDNYIPRSYPTYDSLPTNYSHSHQEFNNPNPFYEDDGLYPPRSKSRSSRNSTRVRSKSVEKNRKKLPPVDNFSVEDAVLKGKEMANRTISGKRNFSAPVRNLSHYDLYNGYPKLYPGTNFPVPSPQGRHLVDFNYGAWSHYQRASRDGYRPIQHFPPTSPLDSGLSSQSVASSPSLDAEPIHVHQIPDCGSPVMIATMQKNKCSCTANSCAHSNAISPPVRNDSGRSSPWAQTAVLRLNALTEAENMYAPFRPRSHAVTLSADDVDQKRYSMSGIYVNPREENVNHAFQKSRNFERKKDYIDVKNDPNGSMYDYEYVSNKDLQNMLYDSQKRYLPGEMSDQFHQLKMNTDFSHDQNKIPEFCQEAYDKSPAHNSPMSLTNSPTELYSPISNKSENESRKSFKKSSKDSEKAICELEEMYNKLNLQDYDLLDRAERRDLPTPHQAPKPRKCSLPRSKSDSFFEILGPNYCNPFQKPPRAPPMRRSGIPDLISDDMALRKLQKRDSKPYQVNDNASYMLYSSHFTPSLPLAEELWLTHRPDIEYDDFSFRRYFHLSSGKVSEPQPPFGIPLNPNPPQSVFSDYLHVVPSGMPQPICHPRGNPDVVRDDLAFRSLRKDNPERAMYDSYSLLCRKAR